ncbi:hypothetical protein Tco_1345294 [Tanacetum coccineum]
METHKPLLKDIDGEDVDEHLYRSMIGSLMYLTSSRPDIMFVVCACPRYQVNPKVSHFFAVKRIFRYLKGQLKLGFWYPKDSPFDLVAYTDSDYARASLDRKSTTGGCQFLGCRLISWQCKKQIVVANSITEAEYIAASNCYGQSTIYIVKNPVFHSKTKHIEIRHHCIRDSNKKKLIQMIRIHTDQNVADLLIKAFDVSIFQYLIAKHIADEVANEENVPTQSNDPPLSRVNTLGSGEERLSLKELMNLCTKLYDKVLDLETTKTAQAKEIASLKKRMSKKLRLKRIKAAKPKVRGVMIQELSEFTTTTITTPAASKLSQDKGKAKMIESEEPLKIKPKDQVLFGEQEAIRQQA